MAPPLLSEEFSENDNPEFPSKVKTLSAASSDLMLERIVPAEAGIGHELAFFSLVKETTSASGGSGGGG
ncbi:hypothetical protein B712_0310 [Chlamydia psittaci NJ1]|nr:hypothetical protein B712_0310 [Chlamydia psittaci NJ1]